MKGKLYKETDQELEALIVCGDARTIDNICELLLRMYGEKGDKIYKKINELRNRAWYIKGIDTEK